jgi:uncharacterized protein
MMPAVATTDRRLTFASGGHEIPAVWLDDAGAEHVLLLGHGAGGGMESPFLEGFAQAMRRLGVATLGHAYPYSSRPGRRPPDRAPVLLDATRAAFEVALDLSEGRPVLAGGKSMGGRIASMAVADGMAAAALIFLGYPLHPPGRPDRLRDAHLDDVRVPMLFLQGTADPFATPELLETVVRRLGPRAVLESVDGAGHSFHRAGTPRDPAGEGASLATTAAAFARRVGSLA